jgi:hypothetical protein
MYSSVLEVLTRLAQERGLDAQVHSGLVQCIKLRKSKIVRC